MEKFWIKSISLNNFVRYIIKSHYIVVKFSGLQYDYLALLRWRTLDEDLKSKIRTKDTFCLKTPSPNTKRYLAKMGSSKKGGL